MPRELDCCRDCSMYLSEISLESIPKNGLNFNFKLIIDTCKINARLFDGTKSVVSVTCHFEL